AARPPPPPRAPPPRPFKLWIGVDDFFQHLAHESGIIRHQHPNFFHRRHVSSGAPSRPEPGVPAVVRSRSNFRPSRSIDLPAPALSKMHTRLPSSRDRDVLPPRA